MSKNGNFSVLKTYLENKKMFVNTQLLWSHKDPYLLGIFILTSLPIK